jgi:hypothetical protein
VAEHEAKRATSAPAPGPDPQLVDYLRRIVLHQETAARLEQRAERAGSAARAAVLRRRAAERRRRAEQLGTALVAARRGPRVTAASG